MKRASRPARSSARELRGTFQGKPILVELVPDVQIFAAAVHYALHYETPPTSRSPGRVVDAGFFDESWQVRRK